MAIQISEKHLSPLAQKALNNAKNKSQFLRDAIEYYVNSEIANNSSKKLLESLQLDIKEIKELLLKLKVEERLIKVHDDKADKVIKANDNRIIITKEDEKDIIKEDGLTEEEKEEIEKLLDNSLDIFT